MPRKLTIEILCLLEPVKADEVVLEQVSRETEPESIVELEPTAPQISSEAEVAGENSNGNDDISINIING